MFGVLRSQHARQSPQLLPWSGAGQVLDLDPTVDVQGQKLTGPWSIMCEDILMIRFSGTSSGFTSFKNCASRVGIQCLVSGVNLHTSKIFCKWSALCMSPASCHLKNFCLLICATIAPTQRGSVMAFRRTYCAALIAGYLV